jgi:hypothetical protein
MPKVFVVTRGSYSDYGIVAIFSSREKALEITRAPAGVEDYSDFNEIEEYELDEPRERLPGCYRVTVEADGQVSTRYKAAWIDEQSTEPATIWSDTPEGKNRRFVGYGATFEHARRSAEELRRQTLATEGKVVAQ